MTRIPVEPYSARKCGPVSRPVIVVEDTQGRQWKLKVQFRIDDPRIHGTIRKIDEVGSIDPRLWEPTTKRY